jgi:hypothetical protein
VVIEKNGHARSGLADESHVEFMLQEHRSARLSSVVRQSER